MTSVMTSEVDNILKGVVTKSINFDEDKRVIGLGTQTITPTQDGPAPLSKQSAFIVEQTLGDSIGIELSKNDATFVVPVLPQEKVISDIAVPVETADLSSLGSINSGIPAEEKLEEHVDNISSGLAPIFDTFEADKKLDAPSGIVLPPIDETPVAQEPIGGVNMDLFSPINEPEVESDVKISDPNISIPEALVDTLPSVDENQPVQVPSDNDTPQRMPEDQPDLVLGDDVNNDNEKAPENQQGNSTPEDLEIKMMAELNIEAKKMVDIIKKYIDATVERKLAEKYSENKQNNMNANYIDEGPTISL